MYDQATGPAARSARYLQPYAIFHVYFTPKFRNETDYFLYLPLNDSARISLRSREGQVRVRCDKALENRRRLRRQ